MELLITVIADDDELMRESLGTLIETADGLRLAGVARDAAEAVELCRRHRPDVAVLDVHMPGGGPAAAAGIREVSPDTRMIALSGDRAAATRREMLEAGVVDFVAKGSPAGRVLAAIRGRRDEDEHDRES